MDKSLLGLRTHMVKPGQMRRCRGLYKLERHVVTAHNPHYDFLIDCVSKKRQFCFGRKSGYFKNQTFYFCFHNYSLDEAGLTCCTAIVKS